MQLPYRFGRYVLQEKIAQGGMAEIFKAHYLGEKGFSKAVCIKRLLPVWSGNPNFIKMLIDEAKALVQLTHPNIVSVFELGRDGKAFYIAMELVEGIDLKKFFERFLQRRQPLPLKYTLYIIAEILKGLRLAHHKGIVHRDISPQNVLVSWEGQVKITDFGIAKWAHRTLETTQHAIKGKYAYMSPEQARGETIDHRTDLYAAGILLFELLEGRRLFDGENDLAVLERVRQAELPSGALQTQPFGLQALVRKALQKEPDHRYPNAEDLLAELNRIVRQEECETAPEDLADYLRALFPPSPKDNEIFPGPKTIDSPIVSVGRLWLRGLVLGVLSIGFGAVATPSLRPPTVGPLVVPEDRPARLQLSAKPWGEVTIPGVLARRETPLNGVRLSPGTYRLRVFYPPKEKWVEKEIELAAGAQVLCQADFTGTPELICK